MKKLLSLFILMISIIPFSSGMFVTTVSASEVVYSNDNLAKPDINGKEYLGDGWYNLVDNNYTDENNYIRYNVKDGVFEVNKIDGDYSWTDGVVVRIELSNNILAPYTISLEKISEDGFGNIRDNVILGIGLTNFYDNPRFTGSNINQVQTRTRITTQQEFLYIGGNLDTWYNKLRFRIQIEKGDTATPYKVPSEPYNEHLRIQELYGVKDVTDQSKILLIAFIIYMLVLFITIYFKIRWLIGVSALLWLIPITTISNTYIIIISVVMIITQFIIAFYDKDKEEGFN